ncbi:hypothetical protein M6B38_340465 [Iris pallida]|uniref:Uncharacterized protein n=1 Tax=Iris pallida TaxID=29817 RepID=A0AAX6GXN4_IRIPA|nr:hypothetical protein M6B38_340465 [Iris pallida]
MELVVAWILQLFIVLFIFLEIVS